MQIDYKKLNKTLTFVLIIFVGFFIFQIVHVNSCQVHAYKASIDYIRFLENDLGRELVQEKLAEKKLEPLPKEIEDWVFWECFTVKPLSDISVKINKIAVGQEDEI